MSASVGENTLITINFMSDCFVLFDDLDIAAKVRSFQNLKWDARASAWSSLWVQTRGTTVGRGRQKEPGLAQRKFGWKPQKVSPGVAELEPLFRVNPTEHLKSHWWQSVQAQVCLHPAKLHFSVPRDGSRPWEWPQDGAGKTLNTGLGTLLHYSSDPRTRLHGLSASAVIFSFVKS